MNKNMIKKAGIATTTISAALIAGYAIKEVLNKKKNTTQYEFDYLFTDEDQLSAEREIVAELGRALGNNGSVESIRCIRAEKVYASEIFPNDYRFIFHVQIATTLGRKEVENIIEGIGDGFYARPVMEEASFEF